MASSPRGQRLRLFNRGNNRCPICLSSFTKSEVRSGESVTLEHVPPKSLQRGFGITSRALCLTCKDCNNNAGRQIDQAAYNALKDPKVDVWIGGVPHTGSFSLRDGRPHLEMGSMRRPFDFLGLQKERPKFVVKIPNPGHVDASWLKAAYLSVFSLLGQLGYRFAEGEAIRRVRDQIMSPGKRIIKRVPLGTVSGQDGDWIRLYRGSTYSCWVVNFGRYAVILPASWDTSLYDHPERFHESITFTVSNGYFWQRLQFGRSPVMWYRVDEEKMTKPDLGNDLFGVDCRVDAAERFKDYVLVDCHWPELTLLPVKRPILEDPRETE